jgi:hypothetical protein
MELSATNPDAAWAPQACTLPLSDRPLRAAEFDRLFAQAVRGIERPEPARLRFELEPSPQIAGQAAELVTAETGCCSFFTFALTATAGRLTLDISVPPAQVEVLDGLAGRAATATGATA